MNPVGLYLVTVPRDKVFDNAKGTRRLVCNAGLRWAELYNLADRVTTILCDPGIASGHMAMNILVDHEDRSFLVLPDLAVTSPNEEGEVACMRMPDAVHTLFGILEPGTLVIANECIIETLGLSSQVPPVKPDDQPTAKLYILRRKGETFTVIPTEGMTSEDFNRTLEEARERIASRA